VITDYARYNREIENGTGGMKVKISPVEELFTIMNETALILQEELSCTYLEAVAETGENLFQGSVLQEELNEFSKKKLAKMYQTAQLEKYQKEELRKAYQLAILKGMQQNIQANHQMTPDSVGMLVSYLVNKFMREPSYTLLDPAVGTGNLLTTILNQLNSKQVDAIGIDIDDLLIKLAYVNANLQKHPIELFNQDSLELLYVDPVDAVVCDLPIGFYPNDERASSYEIKADTGHTFAHHLFIEQSTRYVKDGGYLFLIIPNGLFESEQAAKLHQFIKSHLLIQGVLQLPESMFKSKQLAKSIFILQKKKAGIVPPKQALLVQLPTLSNSVAMTTILSNIDSWVKENK
jgi:site-specific DNA-methyltransferase (adenine-specific)